MDTKNEAPAASSIRYQVKYYDERLSRKGQGIQYFVTDDRAAAEAFATGHQVYGRPCVVVAIRDGRIVAG